jgi:hypothetical protein
MTRRFKFGRACTALFALVGLCVAWPSRMEAQSTASPVQADNSAYIGSGQTQNLGGSVALVDASTYFVADNSDICAAIASVVTQYNANSNGVVVDARGINASPGSSLQCASSPFKGVKSVPQKFSITVLLPASTIAIETTWVLPSYARLVGEGQGMTVIQACKTTNAVCSSAFQSADLIDMGEANSDFCGLTQSSTYYCQGVGIEHLTIDGNNVTVSGQGVNGIVDEYAQELTYVKDVGIINIPKGGTGLWLATHYVGSSGPFSNIYYSGSGTCAQIFDAQSDNLGIDNTRGIHGLTCTAPSNVSGAAIKLDGSHNSIEDVSISGFSDGILVGSQFSAQGNLIFNVTGGPGVTKLVHISSAASVYGNCPPGSLNQAGNPNGTNVSAQNVCDLTILGVTSAGGSGVYSIYDEITGSHLTDTNVGMYALGEQFSLGTPNFFGYSRFTTSPNFPAWFVGNSPSGGTGCAIGSLYSVTSGTALHTLWGCVGNNGSGAWTNFPGN